MRFIVKIIVLPLCFILPALANASDDDIEKTNCPSAASEAINATFGPGTSANTECLAERDHLSIIAAWNSSRTHRSGNGQQVINVRNIANDYDNTYQMESGDDYEIVVVGYGAGARWLLSDEAYNRTFNVTDGNPSSQLVESLKNRGIRLLMCQNTMRGNGWFPEDLLPGVSMVPAGVTAVIDYQYRGYAAITP